jgi:hypothetical protein
MENTGRKRVNLHLGAHKTATTFIQKVLRASKSNLAGHGIKYVPMQNVRKNVTHRMRAHYNRGVSRTVTIAAVRKYFESRFPEECTTLVVSEENFVGNCKQLYTKSDLYPDAADRLQIVADALQGYEVNVYFCVRDYLDFLPSAYCEYLRHNDFVTFETFLGGVDPQKDYWVRVVEGITGVFGSDRTHVWAYEDFRKHTGRIMAELVSSADVRFSYEIEDARLSMSDMSIRVLSKLDEILSPADTRKLVKAVTLAFPKSEGYGGYAPWDDAQQAFWSGKYQHELDLLRQREGLFLDLQQSAS